MKTNTTLFILCLAFFCNFATAQTRIQSTKVNTGTNAVITFSATLSATPTDGNTLIAVISTRSNTTNNVSSITQAGTTWTRAVSSTGNSSNNTTTEIWYTTAVSGAASTLTITQGSARSAAVIMEYSGLVYGSPLDQVASNLNTSTSTASFTGSITLTTSNDELWIGGISLHSSSYSLSNITNTFYTISSSASTNSTATNNAKVYAFDRVVSTTGTASTGGTVSNKSYWSGAVAAFKVAVIHSFSPISACKESSDVVTINGAGFTVSSVVDFNEIAAATSFVSASQLTAVLPASATPGFIHVNTNGFILESKKPFLIKSPEVPTANITKTTCPTSSDGAVAPNNIPIAVNFDYTKYQYINLGASEFNNLSAFTLEGWVKATTFNRNSFFGQNNAIEIGLTSNGKVELWSEGLRTNIYSPSVYPTDGQWHHIAGTGDGTTMKVYIDGELVATKIHAALPTNKYGSSSYNMMIGGYVWDATTPNYHNGQILKAGFWDTALTNTQIAALVSTPHGYYTGETNLIAGYNFYEGSDTTLSKTPAGTNGTFKGTTVSTWTDLFTYSWTRASGGFSASTKNISALPTGTYNLAATLFGCTSNSDDFVVASNGTESTDADSISGVSRVCPNTEVKLTIKGGILGTGAVWKWYADACGTNEIATGLNAARDTLTITPLATTTYYVRAKGTCNTTACVSKTVIVNATGEWLGTTSTDWNTADNWCGGVPTASTDVLIPTTTAGNRFPLIGLAGAVCKSLTIQTGASVTIDGAYTFDIYGNWTNNGTFTASTSTVIFKASGTVAGTSITSFHNFTIDASQTLTATADTMNITGNWTNNGTFTNNSGTVVFNGTTAQQNLGGTSESSFYNLTISNTFSGGGVKAGNNITVTNVLNLAAANPSATSGALEMVSNYTGYPATNSTYSTQVTNPITSYVLSMGANATTIGQGDVTGKIYRSFLLANTPYTFGNQFTNFNYTVAPDNVNLTVTIGTAYGQATVWGDVNSVKRSYEMVPTGGDGGRVAMNLHYLESELNGATEQSLVTGDFDCGPDGAPLGDEHGRSSYDFTNNYIGLSGVPMDYFQYNITSHNWRTIFILHNYYTGHTTWDGSTSSSWYEDTNWSNGVPGTAMTAIIPDSATTLNDPILPSDNITIGGMQILAGGFLNMNGKTLTIAGYNFNGWEDQSGKSNYSGSTVVLKNNEIVNALKTTIPISGIPHFDTLTINTDAVVTATLNAHIYIAGTFTNNGTFNASGFENTIEYNGGNAQTVISPLNNSYYHLSFSGLGTKILPASAVNILGNLDLSAPITATSNTIVFNGTSAQTISGSSTSALNKITLNNASGLILDKNQAVNDTITFTNGLISTSGSNTLTLGCNAGTLGDSTSRYVNGKLAREYCGIESKFFPIGKGGNYRPLTIARTSGATGTSIIQSEQFESTIAGVLPANTTAFADRFWRISQPTGSQTYTIQINGTGFTPAGTAVILKGNETFEYTLSSLVATTPEYTTAVGVTDFGDFTLGSECLPPTITSHPVANATCELNGTAHFSVSASGTLTYQWQVSTSGTGGTYADISNDAIYSNATTDTLTITNPPLNINGYAYHVVVTSDCGGSSTSNGAVLTVNPQPQGSLSANSICKAEEGFLTWTATAGGTGPFTVIYSNGTVNDTVTNVNSNEPFSVGMHTADKTYTLVSVSNVTCTRTTGFTQGSATVTVNPYISWSGVTSTDWNTASNWCGGIPTSNDNVLIPNAPLNQPIISTSDDGLCNSIIIENGASVTVSTADSLKVSGNMTNAGTISLGVGVLTIAQNTIIENVGLIETKNTTAQPLPISNSLGNSGTVKFSGSAAQTLYTGTFNDIIIDNTAGVTLPPNAVANAQGTLQINSGKLEIGAGRTVLAQNVVNTVGAIGIVIKTAADAPGGSFIFHNAPENPVQAKVDMYSMAYWTWSGSTPTNLKWQFWGIPVRSATVDLNLFYGSYIRKHNEAGWYAGTQPTNLWFYMTQNEPIENIIGYELAQASAKYYNFSGELFNEDIYKVLDYTATGQYPGQHVLSNPYTCGIDIQQIVFGDSAVSEVYLYNSGSYSDWNTATKIGSSPGQYTVSTPATAGAEGIPRTIAPMQGFVVKAIKSSPKATIYIPYATAAITNTERIRAKKADDRVYTVIDVAGSRYSDRMWLFTNPTLTRDYDRSWDGKKINGSSLTPQIFGIENNVNLQIDAVDNVDNTVLGFRKGEDSNYNIKFTHFNIESAYPQLYLFDIQENRMIDISLSETTYNFTASNTTNAPRFKILTSAGVSTEQKKLQVNFTVKYAGNELYIENKTNQAGSLSMYGSNGVEIANYKFASQGITVLKPTFMAGAYIYKTLFENGKTTVGKFIIK